MSQRYSYFEQKAFEFLKSLICVRAEPPQRTQRTQLPEVNQRTFLSTEITRSHHTTSTQTLSQKLPYLPCYLSPAKPVCRSKSNRTGHRTTDWFKIGKGVQQHCILSLCFFHFYAEYVMRNAGLDEAQAGIKIARGNMNNFR